MSYRAPVVLAVSLVILLGIYAALLPGPGESKDPVVFKPIGGEQVVSLELAVAGRPPILIQAQGETRPPNVAIGSYQMVQPYRKTADRTAVADVLNMIYRLQRVDAIDSGGRSPAEFGLDRPSLTMKLQTTHRERPIAIRFGRAEPAQRDNYDYVFCQVEGEERWVYHFFKGYVDALSQPVDQWRTRQVVDFQPAMVNRFRIEHRGEASQPFQKAEVAMNERREWRLTAPYPDRAEVDRVNLAMDVLSQLRAERFDRAETAEQLRELKLDESLLKVDLFTTGSSRPLEVTVGPYTAKEEGTDKKYFAHVYVQGSDEAAWVDATRLRKEFPAPADQYRPRTIFDYPEKQIEKIEIFSHGLGKVVLQREEVERPSRRPGQAPARATRWLILDPPGFQEAQPGPLQERQDRMTADFVLGLRTNELMNYSGVWPKEAADPAIATPECRLTFALKTESGAAENKVFYFETSKDQAVCYIPLGEKSYQRVDVQRIFVDALKRLEWNFAVRPLLSIEPGAVQQVHVERRRADGSVQAAQIVRDGMGWASNDRPETHKVSVEALAALLEKLKELMPLIFLAKVGGPHAAELEPYGLKEPHLKLRLAVRQQDGSLAEKTLMLSERYDGDRFFAKLADGSVVFQIHSEIADLIERLHVKR